ncbi:hypothetical protein DL766_006096 [Monosporascus sp. MC13-8B]|uniref:Uncharacterized protein n=1 Tax=Monosporascus cannonballus TaxID=155416 RepID=A0ABY0H682_9PEZI|nr:hypothetical protein DL763_009185 [Monosporascus cannonballus]RYO85954.1 hypothetical protein DL762_004971 [Monosporascus cannonballus]RYP28027.1 hypothetical protein DL766_006096 [Monosporascus sp. MC13-8B]
MSGTHGMGGVYEDQDQRNFADSSIKEEQRTQNINVEGYMPKDKPRAMNEIRSQEIETATEERYKNDPLSRAQAHGNKPSRGAMADADIQADEEEMLKKKQQQQTDSMPGKNEKKYKHAFAPASLNFPGPFDCAKFATHMAHLRGLLRGFPVRASEVRPNPWLSQVAVWADSRAEFHDEVGDGDGDGEEGEGEWEFRGEYMRVLTMDVSGEKVEQVLEFLDSKA